jgi:hypothetical protein
MYQNPDQFKNIWGLGGLVVQVINKVLEKIQEDNLEKLEGIFRSIDFNNEIHLGSPNSLDSFCVSRYSKVHLSSRMNFSSLMALAILS